MKRILLLGTGGTIACKRTSHGLMPLLSSEEILSFVPDSRTFCSIDSIQVLNIDSTNIQPSHWLTIEKAIEEHYKDYDGFVITHGTDTMAYTAAALSYLIRNSAKPIVITGAQKPIDMENTDARTNLADSLRFASHPNAHGVNIVFDGKVIAGTRGKKERTKSYNAFSSINFPYIATIQEEHILFYLDDKELLKEPVQFFCHLNPNVGLLKLIPEVFIRIFNTDPQLVVRSIPALHIYFFGFCFMALQFTGQSVFVALGKSKQATFFSLLRKAIIVVPLTLILPHMAGLGVDGVFWAEPVSNLFGGCACFFTMLATVMPELKKEK